MDGFVAWQRRGEAHALEILEDVAGTDQWRVAVETVHGEAVTAYVSKGHVKRA